MLFMALVSLAVSEISVITARYMLSICHVVMRYSKQIKLVHPAG